MVFKGSNPTEADGFSKKIKLVMTPLIGIMSSNCDVSVHVSCLNTWCYILYKLDHLASSHSVVKTVWEPILEVIIKIGPVNKNIWSWSFCIELLDNFISAGNKDVNSKLTDQKADRLSKSSIVKLPECAKCSWKYYPIKWSPLDLGNLEFFLNTIHGLIMHGSNITLSHEVRTVAYGAASSLFQSLLRSAKHFLKSDLITYDEVILTLNMTLKFLKSVYENMHSRNGGIGDLQSLLLQLLEAFVEELEPSTLQSPLYKVALDLKNVETSEPVYRFKSAKITDICSMNYMEKVSPVAYITLLYFHAVTKSTLKAPDFDIVEGINRYVKFLLSSYEPLEILHLFWGISPTLTEDLFSMLCSYFNEALTNGDLVSEPQSNVKGREISVLLFGEELICSVEQASLTAKFKDKESESWRSSNIKSSLEFASCFVKLSCVKDETTVSTSLTTRLLLSLIHFVGCLHLEKDITLFIELQEPLLEKTLDYPDPIISKSIANFWNSTYGEQIKLDYPQSLLPILDKPSRKGKIKLGKNSPSANDKDISNRYKVTTTLRRCSKRVELMEGNTKMCSSSKRRHTELTEHQKEVRRAQQGREMDCSGHGPGIRTYTSVDFSQGNEESQESQDFRDADSILEMLHKVN
ncbi:hypothetical protein RND71_009422 [Anisodus tanguticus]|uniref:Telomere-associated protein Rif1 N-terminal domain-containing protein n=1 Tax=Anisodus tanguticus TaxID=243964 RepID=A0AAE1SI97_9SOLA|nr:hypothetical protein RND71_009422 [Anisodus tanguticus]